MTLTIGELLEKTAAYFQQKGIDTPRLDAEVLLAEVLGTDRVHLYTDYHRPLTSAEVDAYRQVVARRGQREPLPYITGHKEFYGLNFLVSPAVLIPRPETELLVEAVLEYLQQETPSKEQPAPQLVEIGIGSGAISAAIAYHVPEIQIVASDISSAALEVAKVNLTTHGLANRVKLVQGPYFQQVPRELLGKVKVVVANPPYLSRAEFEQAQLEVKREPLEALVGGTDGLEAYREIIKEAPRWLHSGGLLALEIGSAQANDLIRLVGESAAFTAPEIRTDYAGLDRIVLTFLR